MLVRILEKITEGRFESYKAEHEGVLYVLKPELCQNSPTLRKISPNTHHFREVASYLLDSKILHFGVVPETVLVEHNGKLASVQRFVEGKTLKKEELVKSDDARKIVIFDLIVNNTDRHIRNCLFNKNKVWAIDNGCCFGQYYNYYYSVLHRYLYSDLLILTDNERKLLNVISKSQLDKVIGPYLEEEEVEQTYYRIQWMLEQENLSFKLMSDNQEDRRLYPSRSKWFKQQMSIY